MRLKEALNAYSTIVKNPIVFSLDYVPRKIYEKAEIIHVRNQILNFLRFKLPQNTLIIGPSGTGKTLSVLKYKTELSQDFSDFEMKYVNCRDAYTSYRVITKLTPIPLRGISLDEAFVAFFSSQKKTPHTGPMVMAASFGLGWHYLSQEGTRKPFRTLKGRSVSTL